ncbi:MAG: tetratricopeptide repeat protein [Phycisphaerae bacterium]
MVEAPELLPVGPGRAGVWWLIAGMSLLAGLVVYWPTVHNDFVNWDDHDYLSKNDYVAERGGIWRIWDLDEKHNQYYPMVFSTFWLEHKITLWRHDEQAKESYKGVHPTDRGFEPWIFHLTNTILHALNAALVVWLLRLLGVRPWVAWLTAGLFAVHPINVASVAWAAERKNVLSNLIYLLSLGVWIKHTRNPAWWRYGVCFVLFILALLSKVAMLTLPATAILCDRLIERRWRWQSWAKAAPMLVIGFAFAKKIAEIERGNAGSTMVPLEEYLRPFAAAGAVWFYPFKILVPVHFPGVYSRWDIPGHWALFFTALAAIPATVWILWTLRRRIPDQANWGLAHYVISLSPMLGLISFNYTQFSFVADHFVYTAGIGLFLCFALALDAVRRRLGPTRIVSPALTVLLAGVLAALGTDSFFHNKNVWKNGQTFWEYTLARNPECWPGHYNLGNIYKRKVPKESQKARKVREQAGDDPESRAAAEEEAKTYEANVRHWAELAAECYRKAALTNPRLHQAHDARARALSLLNRTEEAIAEYKLALKQKPRRPNYLYRLAEMYRRQQRFAEAEPLYRAIIKNNIRRPVKQQTFLVSAHVRLAAVLRKRGQYDEAIALCERALKIDPKSRFARAGLDKARQAKQQAQ